MHTDNVLNQQEINSAYVNQLQANLLENGYDAIHVDTVLIEGEPVSFLVSATYTEAFLAAYYTSFLENMPAVVHQYPIALNRAYQIDMALKGMDTLVHVEILDIPKKEKCAYVVSDVFTVGTLEKMVKDMERTF